MLRWNVWHDGHEVSVIFGIKSSSMIRSLVY